MKFDLVDEILERSDDRIVVIKQVSRAEEYLLDHFPGFPVLPGVMMLETMVHAARALLGGQSPEPLVMGDARAIKFGTMVRPGDALEVEVKAAGRPDGTWDCRGVGRVRRSDRSVESGTRETAVSGRFTMRPARGKP